MLNTAERLFVEEKDDLVQAIIDKYSVATDENRVRLLNTITDPTDLRQWVSVAVHSVTEYLAALEQPSWCARFIAHVAADPMMNPLDSAPHPIVART